MGLENLLCGRGYIGFPWSEISKTNGFAFANLQLYVFSQMPDYGILDEAFATELHKLPPAMLTLEHLTAYMCTYSEVHSEFITTSAKLTNAILDTIIYSAMASVYPGQDFASIPRSILQQFSEDSKHCSYLLRPRICLEDVPDYSIRVEILKGNSNVPAVFYDKDSCGTQVNLSEYEGGGYLRYNPLSNRWDFDIRASEGFLAKFRNHPEPLPWIPIDRRGCYNPGTKSHPEVHLSIQELGEGANAYMRIDASAARRKFTYH